MNRSHRSLYIAFAASFVLHLWVISLQVEDGLSARRFHLRPSADLFSPERFRAADPDVTGQRVEKLDAPAFSVPYARLDVAPSILPIPQIYIPQKLREMVPGGVRPEEYVAEDLELPELEDLALKAARQRAEWYDRYARRPLALFDTTPSVRESRLRARQVVMRAIEAMGGTDALAKITRMQTTVWIEAGEHVVPPGSVIYKSMFLYPVETWHAAGLDPLEKRGVRVEPSLHLDHPNEAYQLYNPSITLMKYRRLMTSPWKSWRRPLLSDRAISLRHQGQKARWHFLDRYLGEGVALAHIGVEEFNRDTVREFFTGDRVESVLVDDYKYGGYMEAFFSVDTGLLLATREGLTPAEQKRFRRANPGLDPPTWTTEYGDYRHLRDVLLPHRIERYQTWENSVILHLEITVAGHEMKAVL